MSMTSIPIRFFIRLSVFLLSIFIFGDILPIGHEAISDGAEYIPPEFVYQEDLRQTITLPMRININQASLNQLNILPGFDADLALKVLRSRPFSNMQDFYRKMPPLSHPQLDRILESLQESIRFY